MTVDLERVATVAARECIRQQVGLDRLAFLLMAVDWALTEYGQFDPPRPPSCSDILVIAKLIEPSKGHGYRSTPVTFANGGQAAHHSTVPGAVERMFRFLDTDTDPDQFTKAFLDVHPFRDGNGRTAWVLWNWLRGTLGAPDPLPDYYGGN